MCRERGDEPLSNRGRQAYLKDKALRKQYKITLDQYDGMVIDQNGRCALCKEKKPLVIDHDHKTGLVRGLLCTRCNIGLGQFCDRPDLLVEAFRYLQGALANQKVQREVS